MTPFCCPKLFQASFLVLGLLAYTARSQQPDYQSPKPLTVAQAVPIILSGVVVVDVRTPQEIQEGRLRDAQVLEIADPDFDRKAQQLAFNKPILMYCRAGVRAKKAAQRLVELGFREVYYVQDAGFTELAGAGLPSVRGQ